MTHIPNERQRRDGVFYTPLPFAEKALQYIDCLFGKHWWKSGEYRLWDMAAGTGHLEYHLPKKALQYSYLSTINPEEAEYLQKTFPAATVFQYDYLNDDVDLFFETKNQYQKLPQSLQEDLANPSIKWIVLLNPPYATSQDAGMTGTCKEGVSDTKIRRKMHEDNLGECSRELFSQFLYRIKNEFNGRKSYLGLFSKIKYINANNDQRFRDRCFQGTFKSGFVFSSANFIGTSRTAPFPVAFILWDIGDEKKLEEQEIILDVFDHHVQKIGTKKITAQNRDAFLSKWIKRQRATKIFPPFGSALMIKTDNTDVRDRIADGFLASLMCCGNDYFHQTKTAFLSGPQASAGSLSVTPLNFEQAMVVHVARRIPKLSWLNNSNQFMQPNKELPQTFIADCAVWSLFSASNQTVALRNIEYKNKVYQIVNHFFPFSPLELVNWKMTDPAIHQTLKNAQNSFVADWLLKQKLSTDAEKVLESGKFVYQIYFANLHRLCLPKCKIETYDAGWRQIKQMLADALLGETELTELKHRHEKLRKKLLPKLQDYGIIE